MNVNDLPLNLRRALLRPETLKQANVKCPPLSPEIPHAEQRQRTPRLVSCNEAKKGGASCPLVRFTLRRVKLLDVDAKYGSIKDLLDGLHHAGLVDGDKEGQVRLEVDQVKVAHYADETTEIEIVIP